jgi:cell division cycle 14
MLRPDHRVHSRSVGPALALCLLPLTLLDRLYFASYTHAPNAHTPFPYPQSQYSQRSPSKRSSRPSTRATPAKPAASKKQPPVYFSVDNQLLYNAFHADFGPLHIGHLYRFAVTLHDVLAAPENADRDIVFWSYADARSESRCYMPY